MAMQCCCEFWIAQSLLIVGLVGPRAKSATHNKPFRKTYVSAASELAIFNVEFI